MLDLPACVLTTPGSSGAPEIRSHILGLEEGRQEAPCAPWASVAGHCNPPSPQLYRLRVSCCDKHHNQKQLTETGVYFANWFQRTKSHQGEAGQQAAGMLAAARGRAIITLNPSTRQSQPNIEEAVSSERLLQECASPSKAALPKPPCTVPPPGGQMFRCLSIQGLFSFTL